ncbi:MAG TPA: 4-hydroxythreonine-4-phosphate dehydrogenase PdxA [Candidatus Omnitrophota bacterium]|nr:4-hydroxythreonine-4-phosphate dehydrogenase PdxA [Candidatus Omnitrophota bacterium]
MIRIGITMGDPAGIGPEIIASSGLKNSRSVRYVVIGDRSVFDKAAGRRSSRLPFQFVDLANVDRRRFAFGRICAEYGKASVEYLDAAMDLLAARSIDCLVTGPISKEAVHKAGYAYGGHTEYLAAKANRPGVVMMLVNDFFRFSLVTRHVPLSRVGSTLNRAAICSTLRITRDALQRLFGIRKPRIIVLGLNPHGSDNGIIGNEENSVIRPALRACRLAGVTGPIGADVAIAQARAGMYDCALAMYHDQALIPLKLTGDRTGVNLTLGLPFVRTSPLHGTAFDIAGKHKADPSSLRAAVNLALRCVQNQRKV